VKRRVLMVDDEEDLVWSTGRQIARERPDLEFVGLTHPEAALAEVRRAPADVLVTDVRMPGMTGLELVVAARATAPGLPVVVVTAYGSPQVKAQVQSSQRVEYLEKPFAFHDLLAAVDRALRHGEAANGFSGAISLPMLPDLVQIYAVARASGALRISHGQEAGAIWFEAGDVVHAVCGERRGDAAVHWLLTWEGGTFSLEANAVAPEHTITTPWQALLVEGCRLLDEARRDRQDASAGEAVWKALGPQLQEIAPQALVVTVDTASGAAAVRQGAAVEGAVAEWPAAVEGLLQAVAGLCGELRGGTLECLSAEHGLVLAWDRERAVAVVFVDSISGKNGPSRFRSSAARWRDTCGRWMSCG
jgi:CheY-like chemotaxis protein